jgi:hypothetical protein
MKEEWLMSGAVVPVDVETTAALVAEIHKLINVVGGMALAQPAQGLDEAAIRADEREACADIVDKRLKTWASLAGKDKAYQWLQKLSAAIRARGNT